MTNSQPQLKAAPLTAGQFVIVYMISPGFMDSCPGSSMPISWPSVSLSDHAYSSLPLIRSGGYAPERANHLSGAALQLTETTVRPTHLAFIPADLTMNSVRFANHGVKFSIHSVSFNAKGTSRNGRMAEFSGRFFNLAILTTTTSFIRMTGPETIQPRGSEVVFRHILLIEP